MSELEPPKCEYCGATRRECSGCGAEVGHTVFYGKPNTRSTDERVCELLEWLREAHNAEGARIANAPFADPERESVEAKQEAFIEVHLKIKELFPACKPSEEEVK